MSAGGRKARRQKLKTTLLTEVEKGKLSQEDFMANSTNSQNIRQLLKIKRKTKKRTVQGKKCKSDKLPEMEDILLSQKFLQENLLNVFRSFGENNQLS